MKICGKVSSMDDYTFLNDKFPVYELHMPLKNALVWESAKVFLPD